MGQPNQKTIDADARVIFKCSQGHVGTVIVKDFMKGVNCLECRCNETGDMDPMLEEVRTRTAERGYTLISQTYVHCDAQLAFECQHGSIVQMSYAEYLGE